MISVSRLLCGAQGPGDSLRYHSYTDGREPLTSAPVVVWNCTNRCNLQCLHCYASATEQQTGPEMDTGSAKAFIANLATFGVPAILFSGGEPLLREDLFDVAGYAVSKGLRVALSSNGTLVTDDIARQIRDLQFTEVGVSLDGTEFINDHFRGKHGAYRAALEGISNCVRHGIRVSLRFTITGSNYHDIAAMFQLAEDEGIDRLCFYHLVYSGRGSTLVLEDIGHAQTRQAVDSICNLTEDLHRRGLNKEVLTVANHADGVYLYLKLMENGSGCAEDTYELLRKNGGNSSGIRISAVDAGGYVHPDQFWRGYSPGNVLERSFSDIWMDTSDWLMAALKNRKALLKGRCGRCAYLNLCNGNMRERAEAVYDDIWAEDPACYLTDKEIGLGERCGGYY